MHKLLLSNCPVQCHPPSQTYGVLYNHSACNVCTVADNSYFVFIHDSNVERMILVTPGDQSPIYSCNKFIVYVIMEYNLILTEGWQGMQHLKWVFFCSE